MLLKITLPPKMAIIITRKEKLTLPNQEQEFEDDLRFLTAKMSEPKERNLCVPSETNKIRI
jgi:hypothetical protein